MARSTVSILVWLTAAATIMAAGCAASEAGSSRTATEPPPSAPDTTPTLRRFQDVPPESRTAVESALELSEKYAQLSDQAATLRQENQRLTSENKALQGQVTDLETRLQQTQKELAEANDLLIEMLGELNNWKSNILGFRSEMRDAARAQLEALLKVLEILGGEAEAGVLERRHAPTLNPEQTDVPQSRSGISVAGEPNGM